MFTKVTVKSKLYNIYTLIQINILTQIKSKNSDRKTKMARLEEKVDKLNYRVKELESKLMILMKLKEQDIILSIDDDKRWRYGYNGIGQVCQTERIDIDQLLTQ